MSKKTTLALVQAFDSSGINGKSVKSLSFENLAMSMESPPVLQATRALLDRLETRLVISSSAAAPVENVDHLLKHLAAPPRTRKPAAAAAPRHADDQKLLRDEVRLLSGDAGVARMDSALSDTRSKFFHAKKNASPEAKRNSSSGSSSASPSPVKQPTEEWVATGRRQCFLRWKN